MQPPADRRTQSAHTARHECHAFCLHHGLPMRCPVRHWRRALRKHSRAAAIRAWVEKCVARRATNARAGAHARRHVDTRRRDAT
ncbi:hypothetical protein X949_5442 [Burkholderia pseudomallei MSHR5609]|nr:hypothetical protein X949_5442 [Burkholderia pseudomallei MSHR5609]